MPTWPSTLPQAPLAQGFAETPPNNLRRSEMDKGPAKVRRYTTRGVREFSMSFRLTQAQSVILEDFHDNTLSHGAFSFDFTHPRTGEAGRFRFRDQPSMRGERRGQFYLVDAQLERLP